MDAHVRNWAGTERQLPWRVSGAGRRTKVLEARTRGPRTMTYGDYGFAPAPVSGGTVDASADLTAGELDLGGDVGFAGADGPALLEVAASLTAMSASRFGSPRAGAAGSIAVKPCRVTTPASRMVAQELATRGVDADARRSR